MKQQATYTFDVNVKRDSLKHFDNEQRLAEYHSRKAAHIQGSTPSIFLQRLA